MTTPIIYSVVHRTITSSTVQLAGSTTYDQNLVSITFKQNTPLGGKIKKSASSGVVNVNSTDYTNLSNVGVPFDLTLNIDDPNDGYIYVDSISVPGFELAHLQLSAEILKELRKLNEGVGNLQRLFAETRENQRALALTGTDHG